jgi:hypothetical protein
MALKFSSWLEARRAPDYSFDRWVAGAEKLKSDLGSMVGRSREEEDKLDKEVDKKKKEVEAEEKAPSKPDKSDKDDDEHEKLWSHLKKTAEEMSKERKPNGDIGKGVKGSKEGS